VIATGKSHALAEFAELAFRHFSLDWQDHTDIDPLIFRPTDIPFDCGNARKALRLIRWNAETDMADVVSKMIEAQLAGKIRHTL